VKRRDRIQRSAETGDWSDLETKARRDQREAAAVLSRNRPPREDDEERRELAERTRPAKFREAVEDGPPDEAPDEYEQAAELPGDEEEQAIAPANDERPTFAHVYDDYKSRGGRASLPKRVLKELADVPAHKITRVVAREVALRLYPRRTQAQRARRNPPRQTGGGGAARLSPAAQQNRSLAQARPGTGGRGEAP
jgi:hypothetical protein